MVPNELHQCDCADIRGAVRWCAAGRRASASDGVPANRYESLLWCTSPSYAGGSYADGRAPVWRVGLRFQINGRLRLHRRNLSRQRGGRKYRDGLTEDRYESNHKPHNNPGNGHGFLRPARRRNRRDVRGRWGELPDRVCDDRREWSRDILLPKLQDRLRPGTITAGAASDTSSITWISNGPNQPPVVSAGPNQTISLPSNSVFLNGSVIDDGLPVGGTLTSLWTELSGPAPVSFSTPNQAQTQAIFSQAGTYVLQLTGNDSQLSTSATTTVVVYPPNQPPVVNPGPDQTLILPYSVFLTFNGTVTDDGLPAGNPLTIQWSEFSGPDAATIYSPTSASTTMSFQVPGIYIFQLSASDGQFTTTKS